MTTNRTAKIVTEQDWHAALVTNRLSAKTASRLVIDKQFTVYCKIARLAALSSNLDTFLGRKVQIARQPKLRLQTNDL